MNTPNLEAGSVKGKIDNFYLAAANRRWVQIVNPFELGWFSNVTSELQVHVKYMAALAFNLNEMLTMAELGC